MVPSAEERFDATLDNSGNADHFLGIAALERAYRDGFLAAVALLRPYTEHTTTCRAYQSRLTGIIQGGYRDLKDPRSYTVECNCGLAAKLGDKI
jgi:hypothetical protein